MTRRLDITEFPRTDTNDLNWIEYYKYRAIVDDLDEETASNVDNNLRKVFSEKYDMRRNENVQTC